jgi:complex iron-sulfur molybdoenzyme family reductase subunit gamma
MRAVKIQLATRTLLNPASPQWGRVPVEELRMGGTPLHLQPSRYVRTVWAGRPLGAVRFLKVQAAHNGKDLLIRLEWQDPSQDVDYGDGSHFPDAAGVLFPLDGDAPLLTMGSEDKPVNAWYWRASFQRDEAENIIARGLGTVEEMPKSYLQARARWAEGKWTVVFTRPLAIDGNEGVRLGSGQTVRVAFAVWEGASQERAGIKSFSKQWQELSIE